MHSCQRYGSDLMRMRFEGLRSSIQRRAGRQDVVDDQRFPDGFSGIDIVPDHLFSLGSRSCFLNKLFLHDQAIVHLQSRFFKDQPQMIESAFFFFGFTAGDQNDLIAVVSDIDVETQLIEKDIFQGFVAAFLVLQKDAAKDAFIFEKGLDFQFAQLDDPAIDLKLPTAVATKQVFFQQQIGQCDLIDRPITIKTVHRQLLAFLRYSIVSSILASKEPAMM